MPPIQSDEPPGEENAVPFPLKPAELLRRAINRTDDPRELKGMLLYVAENLEHGENGVPCVFCSVRALRSPCPSPPCVL